MKPEALIAQVRLENVSKQFGSVLAVDDVSIDIARGNLVTLLGPSGCGKTTTLRMIAGLELPTSGRILIAGKDVTLLPPNERDVSMVFQSYALFPHMTVLENVGYGLAASDLNRKAQIAKAREGLHLVGLDSYGDRLPSELSGGQQQRVACARALVLEPQVLLFDEPLSNLDAKLRRRMREDIRELQLSLGLTSVYVTHDQEEALAVSDRIIVMNKGRVAQVGTPLELYGTPRDSFVADFIGGANLIPCEIVGRTSDKQITLRLGTKTFILPDRGYTGDENLLVLRPGSVTMAIKPGRGPSFTATIRKATYLGSHWEFTLDSEVGTIFATQPADRRFAAGETVSLQLKTDELTIVVPADGRETSSSVATSKAATTAEAGSP
jgi:iron(III) transport system ATP-binding protein